MTEDKIALNIDELDKVAGGTSAATDSENNAEAKNSTEEILNNAKEEMLRAAEESGKGVLNLMG